MNLEKLIIPIVTDTKGAQSGIDRLGASFKEFTGFSLGAAGAAAAVGMAIKATADFCISANKEAIAYSNTLQDMTRVTGMNIREAGMLVQMGDDVRLSQEQIQKAMEMANKKGYETSIASLKEMAAEYKALASPIEKAKFLTDRFGKSGADMGKLLATGWDQAYSSVNKYLVLSDLQVRHLETERLALDNVADAWQGFKLQIGAAFAEVISTGAGGLGEFINKATEFIVKMADARVITGLFSENLYTIGERIRNADLYQKAFNLTNQEAILRNNALVTAQTDAADAADAEAKAADRVTAAMQPYTTQLLYNYAAQGLDAKAAYDLAVKMGLVEQSTDTATQMIDAQKKKLDEGQITAGQYADSVARINQAVKEMVDKEITVTVNHVTNYITTGTPSARKTTQEADIALAGGGQFVIPAGYQNDSYPLFPGVTAQSGETVTVTPRGENQPVQAYIDERVLAMAIRDGLIQAGLGA